MKLIISKVERILIMNRQLLFSITKKDLIVETFKSGKSGGQRRDKVETAVRITHPASGAVGQSQDQRSREQNKKLAFRRMSEHPKFKTWLRIQAGLTATVLDDIEKRVEKSMSEDNLKIEVKKEGKWVDEEVD